MNRTLRMWMIWVMAAAAPFFIFRRKPLFGTVPGLILLLKRWRMLMCI